MVIQWHVIYTYPRAEKKIVAELVKRNIISYLPFQKVVRQWSDRKKKLDIPLFPNYVFVQVFKMDHYKVLSVPGVTRFISFDGKPVTVAEKEINSIKMLTDSSTNLTNEQFCKKGDKVRVVRGPLKGLEGMLLERNGSKRFYIKFDSIEQAVSVAIDWRYLEKI